MIVSKMRLMQIKFIYWSIMMNIPKKTRFQFNNTIMEFILKVRPTILETNLKSESFLSVDK